MNRWIFAALLFLAAPLYAIDDSCRDYEHLGSLYELRSLMLRNTSSTSVDDLIDRRVAELRGPLGGGDFRWVRWVAPPSEAPLDKHTYTVRANPSSSGDSFDASGAHAFAVRIHVPRKRSLLNANNPVRVGSVKISTTVDGRTKTRTESIGSWMNPDTTKVFDFAGVVDRVEVSIDAVSEKPGEAVVEIQFRQALPQDDPENPAYDTITSLMRVRSATDEAEELDDQIARLERSLFPDAEPLPLLEIVADLRRADELMRSSKEDQREKGAELMKETMRRLR